MTTMAGNGGDDDDNNDNGNGNGNDDDDSEDNGLGIVLHLTAPVSWSHMVCAMVTPSSWQHGAGQFLVIHKFTLSFPMPTHALACSQ